MVTTEDPSSVGRVLSQLTGDTASLVAMSARTDGIRPGAVLWSFEQPANPLKTYEAMRSKEATCVLVNVEPSPMYLDLGELPVPTDLVFEDLVETGIPSARARALLPALGGLTLKEVRWLVSLAEREYHDLTRETVLLARRSLLPPQHGMVMVEPYMEFYEPDPRLQEWAAREARFLTHDDHRLRPRGLLFSGPPGVGKTSAAKYLADKWGLPLYRMDIGATKIKWVGESERRFRALLRTLDEAEPCIVLLDEVEKVLTVTDIDGGTSTALMDSLLWWLQEHRSAVLTVMTTNARDRIPPELIRDGRIDKEINLQGVFSTDAPAFVRKLLASYGPECDKIDTSDWRFEGYTSQAALAELVKSLVKEAA